MDASKIIIIILLVIIPVVAFAAYKFWRWYILQADLEMYEMGLMRRWLGKGSAVSRSCRGGGGDEV
jgi:hypothetical protein